MSDNDAPTLAIQVPEALELLNTPVWVWDLEKQQIIWGNPAAQELWGADNLKQLLQMDFSNQPLNAQFQQMAERFRRGESIEEAQRFSIGGSPTTVTCQCQGISIEGYEMTALVEVRQIARSPLDANTESSIEALQHTPAMVSLYRMDGLCMMRNPAAMRSFGFLEPETEDYLYDRICDEYERERLRTAIENANSFSNEIMVQTRQGERWHHFDARIILNQHNNRMVLVNELDIHKRKLAADQAHQLAYYDTLTGLPNRVAFANRVEDILLGLLHASEQSALIMFINLNNFSDINSTFGFAAGDQLLIDVGKRLVKSLPDVAIIARLGADKFAIVNPIKPEVNYLQQFINRVIELFDKQFQILENPYLVSMRMGIALIPEHAQTETEASRITDIALNHSKDKGRNGWVLYNHRMTLLASEKTRRVQQLYEAMAKGHFMLYFQPQIDLKGGQMIGAETLLRWKMEDGSFVSPAEFIPLAEQMGVIKDITRWIIREACRLNRIWTDKGLGPFRVAVNISGSEFTDEDFVDVVKGALNHSGLSPHQLELEITETALVGDIEKAIETLIALKEVGVEIAIDDFGTGHSSLNYLKQFSVDRIKIDKAFVDHAHEQSEDLAIVKTILDLARALKLQTIAEGIEYEAQAKLLESLDCDEGQGYFYSKPLSISEFEAFVFEQTPV